MTTTESTDMQLGIGLLFVVIAGLAAVGMFATATLAELDGSDTMQLLSGVSLAVAILAGGLAIVGIHLLE